MVTAEQNNIYVGGRGATSTPLTLSKVHAGTNTQPACNNENASRLATNYGVCKITSIVSSSPLLGIPKMKHVTVPDTAGR